MNAEGPAVHRVGTRVLYSVADLRAYMDENRHEACPSAEFLGPNISDKDLDMTLHRQVLRVEQKLLEDGHEIMVPKDGESEKAYDLSP